MYNVHLHRFDLHALIYIRQNKYFETHLGITRATPVDDTGYNKNH